jgi:predicted membrane protein
MKDSRRTGSVRILLGALMLLLGVFWLLSNFNIINGYFPHIFLSWELILIVIGIVIFINSNFSSGLTLIVIGTVFLAHRFYHFDIWQLWPAIFIIAGFKILFHSGRHGHHHHQCNEYKKMDPEKVWKFSTINSDTVDEVAVFGGIKRIIESDNFEGGKVTATFGGAEIDLSSCHLAPGENILDITAMFGGVTLFVPSDWKIIIKVLPIFGGFSDERRKSASTVYPDDRTLVIKGTVIFGGGEIKISKN